MVHSIHNRVLHHFSAILLLPQNMQMDLYLRKVGHPQAHDNYRVLIKDNDAEIEIGSLGVQGLDVGHRYGDPHARG